MIKKVSSIDELIYKHQSRYKYRDKQIKNIIGLDIETHEGYSFLLSDSTTAYKEIFSLYDALDFLTEHRFRDTFNFFFNIRYDFQSIIKHLLSIDKELFEELYFNNSIKLDDYKLFFIPKKLFTITKNKNSYRYYDIAQFFEGMSLDNASKLYLNKEKIDIGIDKGNIYKHYLEEKKQIIEYCVYDSILTQKLGEMIYKTILDDFKFNPKSFISKADIASQYFKRYCYIPQIDILWQSHNDIFKYALENYHGGRFEVLKKGYFDYCIEYDINSAYPYQISNLIDINKGDWCYTDKFESKAYYGFYKCFVRYLDKYLSPFILPLNPSIKYNPIGEFTIYLSQQEILAYKDYADIDIIDGWVYYPLSIYYPFRQKIKELYEIKNHYKTINDNVRYLMIKIPSNSLYGKMIQINPDKSTGNLFNPIYGTIITGNNRIELFKTSYPYRDSVISFATDSIVFDKSIDLPVSQDLGKWDYSIDGDGVFIMSGLYTIHGDSKKKNKFRGFNKAFDLFDLLYKYKQKNIIPYEITQVTQYGSVIRHKDKYNYQDLNIFSKEYKKIDINTDHKRLWDYTFSCCGEALISQIESKPILIY